MRKLLIEIRKCDLCKNKLLCEPRPVIQAGAKARILIIGQAPGLQVYNSGIPWNDASGNELRRWLGVDAETFYDERIFALMPMGFCYPGKGKSGDLPPRAECAPQWHNILLSKMPDIKLILLIGQYAQKFYLKRDFSESLTENVRNFRNFMPDFFPLVHPSPRNRIWQKKNSWFEKEVIPELQKTVRTILKVKSKIEHDQELTP